MTRLRRPTWAHLPPAPPWLARLRARLPRVTPGTVAILRHGSTFLLALAVILCIAFVVPDAGKAADEAAAGNATVRAVAAGNDAATCRSNFSAPVTDARSDLDDAQSLLADAQADQQQQLVAGLKAAVAGDDRAYVAAVASVDAASATIDLFQTVVDSARRTLGAVNDRYQNLITAQKATDPATYRRLCRTGPPPTVAPVVPFATCTEARKADQVPLTPASRRWNPALDRDGDGIACE